MLSRDFGTPALEQAKRVYGLAHRIHGLATDQTRASPVRHAEFRSWRHTEGRLRTSMTEARRMEADLPLHGPVHPRHGGIFRHYLHLHKTGLLAVEGLYNHLDNPVLAVPPLEGPGRAGLVHLPPRLGGLVIGSAFHATGPESGRGNLVFINQRDPESIVQRVDGRIGLAAGIIDRNCEFRREDDFLLADLLFQFQDFELAAVQIVSPQFGSRIA